MDKADVTLVGRLVRDPIIRGEDKVRRAVFTVAVNRGRDENKKATFVDCIAWGRRSNLLDGLTKGTTVFLTGYLETDKYTKEVDGEQKTFTKLQANVDTFMVGQPRSINRAEGEEGGSQSGSQSASEETVDVGDVPF